MKNEKHFELGINPVALYCLNRQDDLFHCKSRLIIGNLWKKQNLKNG